jgi:serine/threonine-protein kinase HipA
MKKLEVRLTFAPGEHRTVGQLAEADRRIYFEYDDAFLQNPLWLSPFKLPPEPGLREHRDLSFGPMFGLFDDSLPDGWGLLLMDRYFARRRLPLEPVSPLDRLAYLGDRTMGALTYHPPARQEDVDHQLLNLNGMSREAYRVMAGKSARLLPQLLRAGGSPGGARPKVLVGLRGDDMISGEDVLPEGYTAWLVKFHSSRDAADEGRIEYAYARMAQAAGIAMPATRLFTTQAGDAFFGVARFDREQNRRRHVHTFGNLIHSNFRVPGCDYELLLKVARVLTKNQTDVQSLFRLMVFNILTHNRDDHVKNFAFMLDAHGAWRVAPAYDLTFAPGPGGEHTMTVAGEGREPGREHMFRIAEQAGLARRVATEIVAAVAAAAADWPRFACDAGVGDGPIRKIEAVIRACLRRI